MSISDPISDMIAVINNAYKVKHLSITVPYSNFKMRLISLLCEEGYLTSFEVLEDGNKRDLKVVLKYHGERPVIELLKKVSKPSLRRYCDVKSIPEVMNGLGEAILSTSKGVMTGKQAKSQGLGGEIICFVV